MITVDIPQRFPDLNDDFLIKNILSRIGAENEPYSSTINKRNGRHLIITTANTTFFISVADSIVRGRNSYIIQFIATTYVDYIKHNSTNKKLFVFYPYSFNGSESIAPYHHFANRLMKTVGISILNEEEAFQGITAQPFTSFEEMKNVRDTLREGSDHNQSSYITRDVDDSIQIFGKTYGANSKETVILVAATANLVSESKIVLFPVTDHETTSHAESSLEIFRELGVHVEDAIQYDPESTEEVLREIKGKEENIRRTGRFYLNLYRKFGPKKCYMCDCSIDTAIIGAHIHRVTDINNDTSINTDEKILQATDENNGLWLCATHDKLYEYGLVYYDELYGVKVAERLSTEQKSYVNRLTLYKNFSEQHKNSSTSEYLKKHRARVLVEI